MGTVQKAKKVPKDVSKKVHGDSCKRQKVIPIDIMEKVWLSLTVKEYIMRTLIEGGRQTHVDGQTVLRGERLPSSRPSR